MDIYITQNTHLKGYHSLLRESTNNFFFQLLQNPSKIKISNVSFKNIIGTSGTKEGVVLICSSGVPCEDVMLTDIDLTFNGTSAAAKLSNVKPIIQGKSLPLLNSLLPIP